MRIHNSRRIAAFVLFAAVLCRSEAGGSAESVPGMWGTTDTSRPESIQWPADWPGARNLRGQWFKILTDSPTGWNFENHAKGEPPGVTYYLWRGDQPMPEGTKLLLEGDFPRARFFSIQVGAPWTQALPAFGDGSGIPEIAILDEDIVPDPGHANPYRPGADRNARNRHFHVTLELRDGNAVTLNPQAGVPPYRAPGNVRVGGRRSGKNGEFGPYIWIRIYLPDKYEPYGGVEPPVLRIQYPGEEPVIAPPCRRIGVNLGAFLPPYTVAENPVLENGRSVKEEEALQKLAEYARQGITAAGPPGAAFSPGIVRLMGNPDGTLWLNKLFGTVLYVACLKRYAAGRPEACQTEVRPVYRKMYGMGKEVPPPGNDEHNSDHSVFNTYLGGAASVKAGSCLVFRGKLPKFPRTLSGEPIMEPSDELRYWGLTLQVGTPLKLTPVVSVVDEELALDSQRRYMLVIGAESDRPKNATAENGITWRALPVGTSFSVNIRILSTSAKTWEHAPQLVTWDEGDMCQPTYDRYHLKKRMGEYYPEGRYMTRAQIEALGRVGDKAAAQTEPPAAVSKAADKQPLPAGDHTLTVRVAGVERRYTVHVPRGHDGRTPMPVVVMLHGGGGTGPAAAVETGWGAKADEAGFLAVFPDAMSSDPTKPSSFARNPQLWNDGSGRFHAGEKGANDVAFMNAMLDDLSVRFAVDPQRIFFTGFSNGASMSFRSGAELSQRIAAIAPVAGACWLESLSLARPVPMCYITGTADSLNPLEGGEPRLAYGGGGDTVRAKKKPPVRKSIQTWAEALGCPATPAKTSAADGVRIETYGPGRGGAEVIYVEVEGLGHTWPGGKSLLPEFVVGKQSDRLKATDFIWDFFRKHPMAAKASGDRVVAQASGPRRTSGVTESTSGAPVLRIAGGPIRGEKRDGVLIFKGIPFAAPPVGERRWKAPAPPEPWSEPRACVEFGPSCPQPADKMAGDIGRQSEDCLYLNVWTAARKGDKAPVMVWIHGGGFYIGSGSQAFFDGTQLAKRGVVLVTINYRLGPFGFFAHPLLSAESPHKASGNYGLMDQIAALKWVQENIAQFGGDPKNVTIFGESAGAASVCILMTSPPAKGLFHRGIAQSGGAPGRIRLRAEATGPLSSAESAGLEYAGRLGVENTPDALKSLRAKSADELLKGVNRLSGLPGAGTLEYVIVDGYVLAEPPADVLAEGRQANVPLLIGTNADEGTIFASRSGVDSLEKYKAHVQATFRGYSETVLKYYPASDDASARKAFCEMMGDGFVYTARNMARRMSAIQSKTFLYQFVHVPPIAAGYGLGSFHACEIPYVFGNLQSNKYKDEDRNLSAAMAGYWIRFARTGDPNGDGAPAWPAYNTKSDKHLVLGPAIQVGQNLRKQTCDWLESLKRGRQP